MGKFIKIVSLALFLVMGNIGYAYCGRGGNGGGPHGGGGGGNHCVPEIDPSLAPGAIALLTGGVLILRSKLGKK